MPFIIILLLIYSQRVEPDGDGEQLIPNDSPPSSKSTTSSSDEDNAGDPDRIISPSDVKNSMSEVVRSPFLARRTVDQWLKYHRNRRTKKLIIDRDTRVYLF